MQIRVEGLAKVYEPERGLTEASFTINRGESVAIIGHNGAGKSTLLKMLAGWITPDRGDAFVDGVSIRNRCDIVTKIGFVPETPNLFEGFSVEYNIKLFAKLFNLSGACVEQVFEDFELQSFRKKSVQSLSKGLKQRVSFGRSMLPDPAVLLLDEPTSGLDQDMTKGIYRLLTNVHQQGRTIVFTSHRPEEVRLLATRIVALERGRIIFDGPTSEYLSSKTHEHLYS